MTGSPSPSWIHLSNQKMLRGQFYPHPTLQAPTGILFLQQDASEGSPQCLVLPGHSLVLMGLGWLPEPSMLFTSYTLQFHFLEHAVGREGTTVEHLLSMFKPRTFHQVSHTLTVLYHLVISPNPLFTFSFETSSH